MDASSIVASLVEIWTSSPDETVVNYGNLLKNASAKVGKNPIVLLDETGLVVPPSRPDFPVDDNKRAGSQLRSKLASAWPLLAWKRPPAFMDPDRFDVEKFRFVELLRAPGLAVRLVSCGAGLLLAQHATSARELVYVLSGVGSAKIGPVREWIEPVDREFYEFLPTAPQVIQASDDHPFVYVSVWTMDRTDEEVRFWFSDAARGQTYSRDIMAIENVEEYYNKMASDYEDTMFGWGYCMPDAIADALVRHGGLAKADVKILDLGCGNGLSGQALYNRGLTDINGVDFSSEMLKQCTKRACYTTLQRANLLEPLPFPDDTFDCLISVAVTTYLSPSVLSLWLKVAKPGGLIAFTHKTSVWPKWEAEHDRLENELGAWEKVWISLPIPYLPSLKEKEEPCKEMAKVYIYRKM